MEGKKSRLLTSKQVIQLLHINKNTLTKLIKNGEIGYIQIANKYLFPQEEVEAFLKKHAVNLHTDVEKMIERIVENMK